MNNPEKGGKKKKFPFKGIRRIEGIYPEDKPSVTRWARVKRESSAHIVLCVSIYGWRGNQRLARRTLKGYFKTSGEAKADLENGGWLQNSLAEALLEEFREKAPKGQIWEISEVYARNPIEGKPRINLPYYD